MKKPFLQLSILLLCLPLTAATIVVKISQFPNTTAPAGGDLFLLASGATNKNITWNQLKDAIGTNPATVTILNTLYVSNAFITNLTVLNEYHGKTMITTNIYVDYITNNYSYTTNLYVSTNYVNTEYVTNLYLTEVTTNYFLFSTNIYQSYPTYVNNTYVSNYFQTNAFLNTYVSNYFNTNLYNYYTNLYHYSTNLTVTNFYLTDNYISNFFNTNIFFVDNTVSNFFATNIYNTINISSNYTYQYDLNLTNPVFYGEAWIDGYADHPNPKLTILSTNGYPIELDGATGDIRASGGKFDTIYNIDWDWDGPTNFVELYTTEQFYNANTDCQITGFDLTTVPFGRVWNGTLTITNSAATNITLRLPAGLTITDNTNAVVVSNATRGMLWIKLGPRSGTNGVYRNYPQ